MAVDGRSTAQGTLDLPVHVNVNEDYDWDAFDPQDYFAHNYASMRTDDAKMLAMVRDWFAAAVPAGDPPLDGIDVGSGANLYPALALLPHCDAITLYEYARENVEWLEAAVRDLPDAWRPFWRHVTPGAPEQDYAAVRERMRKTCTVSQGSIFELEQGRWELGTMFFVAESLTEDRAEFGEALRCFFGALRPGAPFAAAFMEHSEGYDVGDLHFPAISIDRVQLRSSINSLGLVGAYDVRHVEITPTPLRAGYTGYLVAIGHVKD
jgi:hypothetical protein